MRALQAPLSRCCCPCLGEHTCGGDMRVTSGLAPTRLVGCGWCGYSAVPHGRGERDAVRGMRVRGGHGATRGHRPGLSQVPLPPVWQAVTMSAAAAC